jgi:hypothetical protein
MSPDTILGLDLSLTLFLIGALGLILLSLFDL